MTWPGPIESNALDRRHLLFSWAIGIETAIAFGVPVLLLMYSFYLLSLYVDVVFDARSTWPRLWPAIATPAAGWSGITGIVRVLFLLYTRQQRDPRAALTLVALACGVALAPFQWYALPARGAVGGRILFVYLPLACTMHLVYLARRALFVPQRERSR